MSRSYGRALLTALPFFVWFHVPCSGQVFPTGKLQLPRTTPEAIVLKTHDLSSAIAAHVRSSKLPAEQAKSNAVAQLFALSLADRPVKRIEVRPGIFKVAAPAPYHEHLTGLAKWMAEGEKLVVIESRILTVSEERLRQLHSQFGMKWEMTDGQPQPVETQTEAGQSSPRLDIPGFGSFESEQVQKMPLASSTTNTQQFLPCRITRVSDQQLARVINEAKSDAKTNIIGAPRVTMFPGQETVISDTTQRPFVTSVKPSDDATAGAAVEPVITVLEDGLSMRIRVSVTEKNGVYLNSDLTIGEIGDVDTFTFETPGQFSGVTVQIPEYTARTVSVSKKLLNNQSLIIDPHFVTEKVTKRRFRSDVTKREFTIVILTARVIQQPKEVVGQKVAKL